MKKQKLIDDLINILNGKIAKKASEWGARLYKFAQIDNYVYRYYYDEDIDNVIIFKIHYDRGGKINDVSDFDEKELEQLIEEAHKFSL